MPKKLRFSIGEKINGLKYLCDDIPKISKSGKSTRQIILMCHCGKIFSSNLSNIRSGNTTSCGCVHSNIVSRMMSSHRKSKTRIYNIWNKIKSRIFNENNNDFIYYGGRGISMCEEWRNDFMSFYNWAIANGYEKGLTIDRIDNDRNYEPSNCRWVNRLIQSQNTRLLCIKNKSGFRGVHFGKKEKKWKASISYKGTCKYLGCFENPKDAAITYNNFVIENGLSNPLNPI